MASRKPAAHADHETDDDLDYDKEGWHWTSDAGHWKPGEGDWTP